MKAKQATLSLGDAIRIKSAELWLKLGHTTEAVAELQQVSEQGRRDPWVNQVLRSAFRAAGA